MMRQQVAGTSRATARQVAKVACSSGARRACVARRPQSSPRSMRSACNMTPAQPIPCGSAA
eukprot:6468444-Amphidinium_carterae.3